MHNHYLFIFLLNHSIVIAAVIGAVRLRHMPAAFLPFTWLIWVGAFNETLSLLMIRYTGGNTVNANVFVLVEYLLIVLQFYTWNGRGTRKYYLFAALGLSVWITDNLVINSISGNNSLFRVYASLIILFFSTDYINKMIVFEPRQLWRNAAFIVCMAFAFYFGLKAFVESFNVFRIGLPHEFLRNLWMILYFVNFIANLLYAVALLCIPTRQEFTWRY